MACSYTDESFSSSMSMQSNNSNNNNNNNPYTLPLLPSDSFLGLQLTDYLDNQPQNDSSPHSLSMTKTTPPVSSSTSPTLQAGDTTSLEDDPTNVSPLLWVPADRHPEIAPSEFAHWLETNGSNNVARKTSLRRKSSVLSNIHIPIEESDSTASAPPTATHQPSTSSSQSQSDEKQGTPLEFDRHSPAQDTSRVLAPRGNRSLLRRSAFSARGRGRKQTGSRHGQNNNRNDGETTTIPSTKEDQSSIPTSNHKPTMEPVRLYDRPVSMSEWIDLGSASLVSASDDSQHGILSRVHDAESNLLSQYNTTTDANGQKEVQDEATALSPPNLPTINETSTILSDQQHSIPSATSDTPSTVENASSLDEMTPPPMTTTTKKSSRIQRASSERLPNKQERKSNSWFGGLFGDKDKKRGSLRRVEDERQAQQQRYEDEKQNISMDTSTTSNNNRKSGIGSLFSRSKSEHKTNNKRHHLQKLQQHVIPGASQSNAMQGKTTSALRQPPHGDEMALHGYRLPIHVERAIYRLSHFKLADPRRPLHDQVAISNLMFWYIGVINTQQQQQQQTNPPPSSYPTLISNPQQPLTNTATQHFDETATQLSPHDQKGQKTGRIGIPKPRLMNNNSKGSLTAGVTSQEHPYRGNSNGFGDSASKNDDDDLPLSYYKQS